MKFTDLMKTAIALPLIGMLGLYGCGGGGGSTTSMAPGGEMPGGEMPGGETPGGETPGGETPTLMPATGLTPSAATARTATNAGDTLAARLPTASNEFAPQTSVLKRDFNQPQSAAIGDDSYIKTLSSDGANGFHVTYVVGGEEETVHFEAGDYGAGTSSTNYYKEANGRRYWLWSYTGSITGPQKNMGATLVPFRYFDKIGTSVAIDGVNTTNYLTYGLRTDADALPSGSAHYGARLRADIYGSDAPSTNDRTRVWANVRLTVDFGEGSLDGDIRGFRMQEPGQSTVTLPLTVYADIENGQIVDGRFTATWTQVNPGEDAFAGNILGEFYGPNAEEVGAVLNGTNDDEVIAGVIGGWRPTPSVPAGDLAVLSSGSYQDLPNSTATAATASVIAIAGDGADGFNLTYTIGADTHRVQFGADDFGADTFAGRERNYFERSGNRTYSLFDQSRSFLGNPEFSHFNVNGWVIVNYTDENAVTDFHLGYAVYGAATEASAMPTGTANYAGRMFAQRQPPSRPGRSNRGALRGALNLSANFDQGTVGGSVDNLQYLPPGRSWVPAQAPNWTIENGSISGNALSAEFSAAGVYEGDMEGRFFGPDAAEVGGTIQGTGLSDNGVIWGYFGGKKQ